MGKKMNKNNRKPVCSRCKIEMNAETGKFVCPICAAVLTMNGGKKMKKLLYLIILLVLAGCSRFTQTEHGCRDNRTGQFVSTEHCKQ